MADSRFFTNAGPFSLAELAGACKAELSESADPDLQVDDVAPVDVAGAGHLTFLDNRKYVEAFKASKASAAIIHPKDARHAPDGMHLLLSEAPYTAYAQVAQAFYPESHGEPGVHERAWVDPTAALGADVRVEAGAVIGARAAIGARTVVMANAVIGDGVVIGDDCLIGSNASVSHAVLGRMVRIYPGVRIGQDGFGFAPSPSGFVKVPQLGRVMIGDDVEVGANTTIDRGAGPDTVIGPGLPDRQPCADWS